MNKILLKLLVLASIFMVPKLSFGQFVQYLGTKDNIVETRNIAREDSAHEFGQRDTSNHSYRAGTMISFNGSPYWWNGIFWYKLNGDTSTSFTQVNSDWTATTGAAFILNKPTFATVATSGSYLDLSNKPSIPAGQINSDWGAVSGLSQILNKPRFVDSIYRRIGVDSMYFVVNRNGTLFTYSILDSAGGSSGGGGTVDSVFAGNLSPLFTTSITNQAIKPTINFTPQNVTAHKYYGNNTGSTGLPIFNSIVLADLPTIPISQTDIKAAYGIKISGDSIYNDTSIAYPRFAGLIKSHDSVYYVLQTGQATFGKTLSYIDSIKLTNVGPGISASVANIGYQTGPGEFSLRQIKAGTNISFTLNADSSVIITSSGGSGLATATGDASGTVSGTNLPLTLAAVNSNIFGTQTLVKLSVNGKGLITGATAASVTDITTALGYPPYYYNDTLTTLVTKSQLNAALSTIDTIRIIPVGVAGLTTVYGRNDSLFNKKIVNAVQNSDSSITVGNVIASNNLSDLTNLVTALNNLLPSQTGNAGKAIVTNGSVASWQTVSGGSGTTNVGVVHKVTYDSLTSSSGTGAILDTATTGQAGLESILDKTKLSHPIIYINDSDVVSINVDTLTYANGDSLNFKAISYLPGIKHFSTQNAIYLGLDTSYVKTLAGWGGGFQILQQVFGNQANNANLTSTDTISGSNLYFANTIAPTTNGTIDIGLIAGNNYKTVHARNFTADGNVTLGAGANDTAKIQINGNPQFQIIGNGQAWFNNIPTGTSSMNVLLDSLGWVRQIAASSLSTSIPPNIGSGFRIYAPQTPGFKTLYAGANITIDSTTNTNGLTIIASAPSTTLTRQTIASGTSATGTSGNLLVRFNLGSTGNTFTFTMPASPSDQQIVAFQEVSGSGISNFTLLPNSGQSITQASSIGSFQAGEYAAWQWDSTFSTWMRMN